MLDHNNTLGRETNLQFGFRVQGYSPPEVERVWLTVYCNKVPIYPIFHLLGTIRV